MPSTAPPHPPRPAIYPPDAATRPSSFVAAERLEAFLGDPADPSAVLGYTAGAAADETEVFPVAACARLDAYGLPRHYVPVRHGGLLASYEDAVALMRTVARRDLTVAIAHGKTYLGAASVWVAGTDAQARELGELIASGVPVSWGLTERDHGSDLLAGDMLATRTAGGFRVSGEKWLINNATRSGAICTLVRTDPEAGPRGYSLLLIDKRRLGAGEFAESPKVPTAGIRAADISGFILTGAVVPQAGLVGREGQGLEIVLKGMQLTRTLCAALSLGAADHALRLVTEFAGARKLYDRPLLSLPLARRTLAECYADQLLSEALTLLAARTIHAATGEMSLWSAVVKYLVPTHTETALLRLRRVLGARSQLLDGYAQGRFQKLERDNAIVSLFDGNTLVNLNSLINQFPLLARVRRHGGRIDVEALRTVADLSRELPEFDAAALSLVARNGAAMLHALPDAVATLSEGGADVELTAAATHLMAVTECVLDEVEAYRPTPFPPAAAYELARRVALCLAGAAVLQLWLHNRNTARGPLWDRGVWLTAVLARLLDRLGTPAPELPVEALIESLVGQQRSGHLLSLFDCRLAEAEHR